MKKISAVCYLVIAVLVAGCAANKDSAVHQESNMSAANPDSEYSSIGNLRPRTESEQRASAEKWNTSRLETRWQDYKGTMVRVEILLGDSELREMRLKLSQNADGGSIDGDMRSILDKVAKHEMERVCGRNAKSVITVYNKESFDVVRPNPFFDYRVENSGGNMREYGFRCIYN